MASTIYANHDAEYKTFAAYTADNDTTYGFTAEQMIAFTVKKCFTYQLLIN